MSDTGPNVWRAGGWEGNMHLKWGRKGHLEPARRAGILRGQLIICVVFSFPPGFQFQWWQVKGERSWCLHQRNTLLAHDLEKPKIWQECESGAGGDLLSQGVPQGLWQRWPQGLLHTTRWASGPVKMHEMREHLPLAHAARGETWRALPPASQISEDLLLLPTVAQSSKGKAFWEAQLQPSSAEQRASWHLKRGWDSSVPCGPRKWSQRLTIIKTWMPMNTVLTPTLYRGA